jgi:hypothetical protein
MNNPFVYHPRLDEHGRKVLLARPSEESNLAQLGDAGASVTFVPASSLQQALHGILLASWSPTNTASVVAPVKVAARTAVEVLASPFRKIIWNKSLDYDFGACTEDELDNIALVYSVFAAKLNIAFPSRSTCSQLVRAIASVPAEPETVDPRRLMLALEQYLKQASGMSSVGVATAVCLLAVHSNGRYAPMDRKVALGMCNFGILTSEDEKTLRSTSLRRFVEVYVSKVLPAWHTEVKRRGPQQADAYFGTHASISE